MTKLYTATQLIAEHLAKVKIGEIAVLPVILKEQPPDGYIFDCLVCPSFIEFVPESDSEHDDFVRIKLQYPIGTTIGVKETWGYDISHMNPQRQVIILKSEVGNHKEYQDVSWHSASTMPKDAIRWFGTVTGNRVCRVQEMTYDDITSMGFDILLDEYQQPFDSTFRQYWNSQHAKKGYGWDKNPFLELLTIRRERNDY